MKNEILRFPNIRNLRELNGLSQSAMANYLNVNQNTYSRYETNERSIPVEILMKLADYYDTSVDYLLSRTDERKPYSIIKN